MSHRRFRFAYLSAGLLAALALVSAAPASAQGDRTVTRFVLAPAGNEARYRVREQFVGVNLPNDAVGATSDITGALVLDETGQVVPGPSRFVVDIRGLESDSANRDRVIQGRVLETDRFPTVDVAVTALRGLPWPLPQTGELAFELLADMTVHGETRPSTWQVAATPRDGGLAGTATTSFTFGEFGMPVPTSFRILSVEDNVRLEYDFHLVPAP